jgi:serralysin
MALLNITSLGLYDLNQLPYLGGAHSGELANRVLLSILAFTPGDSMTLMTHGGDDVVDATGYGPAALLYLGAGNDTLYVDGDSFSYSSKTYYDQAGNDTVYLDESVTIHAGKGNDRYVAGLYEVQTIDFSVLTDLAGNTTSVTQGITFDLALTTAQNLGVFGKDVISGFEGAVGSAGHDKIFGTNASNTLHGGHGNDLLDGRAGSDMLRGGDGADTLIGGAGSDSFELMAMDSARDTVRYLSFKDSGAQFAAGTYDYINGFVTGEDKIDLSALDADLARSGNQTFLFRSTGDFRSKGGEVLIETIGSDSLVLIDNDGDLAPEMVIRVVGVTNLTASDFIL